MQAALEKETEKAVCISFLESELVKNDYILIREMWFPKSLINIKSIKDDVIDFEIKPEGEELWYEKISEYIEMIERRTSENKKVLKKAIKDVKMLKISYEGGSQPGAVRQILPVEIDGKYLKAKNIGEGVEKTYKINKIIICEDNAEITYDLEKTKEASAQKQKDEKEKQESAKRKADYSNKVLIHVLLACFTCGIGNLIYVLYEAFSQPKKTPADNATK